MRALGTCSPHPPALLQIITRFAKRMYTDKLLKLFACVVAVVVVGIIVLAVL